MTSRNLATLSCSLHIIVVQIYSSLLCCSMCMYIYVCVCVCFGAVRVHVLSLLAGTDSPALPLHVLTAISVHVLLFRLCVCARISSCNIHTVLILSKRRRRAHGVNLKVILKMTNHRLNTILIFSFIPLSLVKHTLPKCFCTWRTLSHYCVTALTWPYTSGLPRLILTERPRTDMMNFLRSQAWFIRDARR